MRWRKEGLIYCPDGSQPWAQAHAMIPTPIMLDRERIRVYFSSTDGGMVGRVGYVELDAKDPRRILKTAQDPVLGIGEPGMFDDNGVNITSIVRNGDALWLYYFGYQLGTKVRYFLFGGAAVSNDGGESFERVQRVPVIDRTQNEPLLRSAPFVLKEGNRWRMWHVGGDRYIEIDGTTRPTYDLRYLTSDNGIDWGRDSKAAVSLQGTDEYGLGRPYVLRCAEGYRMWYSIRTHSLGYRLGYAVSSDGVAWTRRDDVEGMEPSGDGWDSDMVCYAAEFETDYGCYLFYNGNEYGRTGFGFARLDSGSR